MQSQDLTPGISLPGSIQIAPDSPVQVVLALIERFLASSELAPFTVIPGFGNSPQIARQILPIPQDRHGRPGLCPSRRCDRKPFLRSLSRVWFPQCVGVALRINGFVPVTTGRTGCFRCRHLQCRMRRANGSRTS